MPQAEEKSAGVLGWPLGHSLSPRLHNYWLKQYHIKGSYDAFPTKPEDLEQTLKTLSHKGFAGVNLTIPHKEKTLFLVDSADDIALRIGAVNTVTVQNGKLHGTNTDAYGFMANLQAAAPKLAVGSALLLGAGGAARAVCAGLLDRGWKVSLSGRRLEKAESLAAHFGKTPIITIAWENVAEAMAECSLLVNTTPLGMKGQEPLALSLELLSPSAHVYDIVYNPLMTPLLEAAQARGNPIVTGLGMLMYQAQPAFEMWFGVKPEVTQALHDYMEEALK